MEGQKENKEDEENKENEDENRGRRIFFEPSTFIPRERSITTRTMRRTNSHDTIAGTRSRRQSFSDLPIQYRTVSIHIDDSKRLEYQVPEASKHIKAVADERDYFERLDFHTLSVHEICQQLDVSIRHGLTSGTAAARLQRDGKNTLATRRENYFRKLLTYIFGGFCGILWLATLVFFLAWRPLSDPPSVPNLALAILVIIVIFLQASFSAFQDWSTQRVMNSILSMLPADAHVLRDGGVISIPATNLVVGDIVRVSIGDKVPADLRLLETSGDIRFDRSMLTGEPDEIEGAIDSTDDNFLETRNIAAMGTNVANGNGTGIVILTGGKSIMGRISNMTAGVKDKATLIQQEISRFIRIIIYLTVVLASAILLTWIGWLRVQHFAFMNVAAMLDDVLGCVVAFIPEGVPVGVALTLLMVARRMKTHNVLPKGLSTVETLGCVNVICSDKTGTLTENKMVVTTVGFVDKQCTLAEAMVPSKAVSALHRASTLCNDASWDVMTAALPIGLREINGNATDAAVFRFAHTVGPSEEVTAANPRIFQIPFNSKNKWMLTMHEEPNDQKPAEARDVDGPQETRPHYLVYVKGAPDVLLPHCVAYWKYQTNEVAPLDDAARANFSTLQERLSRNAERVILLCQRSYSPIHSPGSNYFGDEISNNCVQDLTIIGVLGITDPPRAETAHTVSECRRAGARFFMVTGDFGLTAAAIARNVGIFTGTADPETFDHLIAARMDPISKEAKEFEDKEGGVMMDEKKIPLRQKRINTWWRWNRGRIQKRTKAVTVPITVVHDRSLLLEGPRINRLTQEDWGAVCAYGEIVFARTTPEQKLRIVNEFKARGFVLAVTGDGVNDAPALKAADVGIAVVSGSDVAKEAADLILLGGFDSIIDAIRLGRLVFQNLQKLICYLLPAGSWSEIWPVLLNVFFGVPLPLTSFLMIIICIFTDLFLCLALIMEKEEFDLLELPPRDHKKDHLINFKIYIQSYLFIGILETVCAHAMFFLYMYRAAGIPMGSLIFAFEAYSDGFYGYSGDQLAHFNAVGQCVYFVTLVILQWGNILSVRNKRLSIMQADPFRKQRRNPWLFLGALISFLIAVFVTEVPAIQNVFGTASVPIEFWLIPVPLAIGILIMDEVRKLLVRLYPKGPLARIAW